MLFRSMTREQEHSIVRRPLGLVRVKGRAQSVEIFDILPPDHQFYNSREGRESFSKAVTLFKEGNFQSALALLATLGNACSEDGPTKLFTDLARQYAKNPPQNWEGIIEFTEK